MPGGKIESRRRSIIDEIGEFEREAKAARAYRKQRLVEKRRAAKKRNHTHYEYRRNAAKQLRLVRKQLARNRLTMPLFDTRGWVRDFEKALKIQWEIYANGLAPMHIVVARSDRIYGTEVVTQEGAQRNP